MFNALQSTRKVRLYKTGTIANIYRILTPYTFTCVQVLNFLCVFQVNFNGEKVNMNALTINCHI